MAAGRGTRARPRCLHDLSGLGCGWACLKVFFLQIKPNSCIYAGNHLARAVPESNVAFATCIRVCCASTYQPGTSSSW
eukprot:2284007-Rhodomonas_salina.1